MIAAYLNLRTGLEFSPCLCVHGRVAHCEIILGVEEVGNLSVRVVVLVHVGEYDLSAHCARWHCHLELIAALLFEIAYDSPAGELDSLDVVHIVALHCEYCSGDSALRREVIEDDWLGICQLGSGCEGLVTCYQLDDADFRSIYRNNHSYLGHFAFGNHFDFSDWLYARDYNLLHFLEVASVKPEGSASRNRIWRKAGKFHFIDAELVCAELLWCTGHQGGGSHHSGKKHF